ncbi:MAG: trypsin-like peptidase domain-containing protein [Planctomycetota bacterium]
MMRLLVIATGFAAFSFFAPAKPVAANPAAAAQSGEVLLLDFAAAWCGPCKQMVPIVAEVASAGWVVRHVDVDRETDLVRRFGVTGVPCYVLLVKGHEVGRINGATTRGELENLLAKAAAPLGGTNPVAAPAAAPEQQPIAGVPVPVTTADAHLATDSPPSSPARTAATEPTMPRSFVPVPVAALAEPAAAASQAMPVAAGMESGSRAALEQQLLAATARLRVEDSSGVSWATGTVIDCRQGEALILTCGHVFRDSQGKGRIEVDLFGPQGPRGIAGQVISWDLKRDLALVSIFTEATIDPVRVGGTDRATPVGAAVVTVGCNGGKDPTIHHSRITAVDKYLGPSNLQVAGQPVQGRSGGGLFAIDGTLIGVCNAADPADNEGLFAALPSIHDQLDETGLSFVYRNVYPSGGLDVAAAGPHLPNMPAEMPDVSFDRRDRADAVPTASTGALPDDVSVSMPAAPAAPGATAALVAAPAGRQTAAAPAAALSPGEAALIDHVRQHGGKAEVICIVRPHGAADTSSEVFVLKGARPDFVDHLSRAHHGNATDAAHQPPQSRSDVAVLPTANPVR